MNYEKRWCMIICSINGWFKSGPSSLLPMTRPLVISEMATSSVLTSRGWPLLFTHEKHLACCFKLLRLGGGGSICYHSIIQPIPIQQLMCVGTKASCTFLEMILIYSDIFILLEITSCHSMAVPFLSSCYILIWSIYKFQKSANHPSKLSSMTQ